jgi:aspartate-semialdehyde dehydrogenase
LRATDAAREEVSGATGGVGERRVNTLEELRFADLHELGIALGKRHGGRIIRRGGDTSWEGAKIEQLC